MVCARTKCVHGSAVSLNSIFAGWVFLCPPVIICPFLSLILSFGLHPFNLQHGASCFVDQNRCCCLVVVYFRFVFSAGFCVAARGYVWGAAFWQACAFLFHRIACFSLAILLCRERKIHLAGTLSFFHLWIGSRMHTTLLHCKPFVWFGRCSGWCCWSSCRSFVLDQEVYKKIDPCRNRGRNQN